jgi:serine protease AprX
MVRRVLVLGVLLAAFGPGVAFGAPGDDKKLDRELQARAVAARGSSRVILRLQPGVSAETVIRGLRGTVGRRLSSVGGQVAYIPDTSLLALARVPGLIGVSLDRRVHGTLERTGATIGASWVRDTLGFDGTGVGIAIIDSGVANWHDDLGSSRVTRFVDFVNFQPSAYDDYGHGTHVAGIIAGNGHDSEGLRRGIAPGATLLVEKVLDATGQGYISNVIAAIDYAIANKDALNIRVINLSVAAGVYESYTTDPLTLAAKRAVESGIVVVSAAGNLGKNAKGQTQYGGIGAPGNAPWVLTVGASSHQGTTDRADDIVAPFSSRGPSAIDYQAKPDIVAPGVGIESIAEAGSTLWNTKPLSRLWGSVPTATEPYLSLSGTSMAAPVVSGTIALMLQANPALTPNLVKAILQYTAEAHASEDPLTQGAGFVNARGAVELAVAVSAAPDQLVLPSVVTNNRTWSQHVIWGNRRIGGGELRAAASAWRTDVIWGDSTTPEGTSVAWGTQCSDAPSTALGTGETGCDNVVWGADPEEVSSTTFAANNVVWGADCGGAGPSTPLGIGPSTTLGTGPSTALGTGPSTALGTGCDKLVWSTTTEGDPSTWLGAATIAWGTNALDDTEHVVWGARPIWRRIRIDAFDEALQ